MATTKYLALLRGINVGGKNVIAKDDLRRCFEDLGCETVSTYIQSGNILFRSSTSSVRQLTDDVQAALSERFAYDAQAVVLPYRKYQAAVAAAPDGWGDDPAQKHNALFTMRGTTPQKVVAALADPKPGIETITLAPGVIFWSVVKAAQTKATYARITGTKPYQQVTIRNSNTTRKLLELLDAM
ncbi:DUF1697 domain-containing protein [Aeoliella mucimassa]|uniref:DUF1697 domain-containing protein n=1 Tax=Aeoliella mucimassa TaxID=2527972 RepID=A0A518AGT7_9BACT|nr:DUF1697 domain-containing protein [Aeoliella mucimassa]QDU53935.1 hypothetical protein Pan181_01140 [Aeoliella mucimassa]